MITMLAEPEIGVDTYPNYVALAMVLNCKQCRDKNVSDAEFIKLAHKAINVFAEHSTVSICGASSYHLMLRDFTHNQYGARQPSLREL